MGGKNSVEPAEQKYFEAHVTIEPVFEDRLDVLAVLAKVHGFKVANLLLRKRPTETPVRSRDDSFCSSRDDDLKTITDRTVKFKDQLIAQGFKVWRYKIEQILVDVKYTRELSSEQVG